jgi:outer membrane murein-binding lipoprotein Lpp
MNTSNLIALISVIATLLGGGGVGVAKLTRIAIAAETLTGQIIEIIKRQQQTEATVQDHENRLNRAHLLQGVQAVQQLLEARGADLQGLTRRRHPGRSGR